MLHMHLQLIKYTHDIMHVYFLIGHKSHTHMHPCMCVCVCVFVCTHIELDSCMGYWPLTGWDADSKVEKPRFVAPLRDEQFF